VCNHSPRSASLLLALGVLLGWLSGCNSVSYEEWIAVAEDPSRAGDLLERKSIYYATHPERLSADLKDFERRLKAFRRQIDALWGRDADSEAGPKDYVKYTDQYYNRAHVDFAAGEVIVETIAPDSQRRYLKKAIVTTLLTPDDSRQVDLFSEADPGAGGTPFLYKQVVDHLKQPVVNRQQAEGYASYLVENQAGKVIIGKRQGLRVVFPLVPSHDDIRAYKYADLVRQSSRKYNVTQSLIYGVIKTESSFNPFAVSHAPAYGLMQIVPSTAGRDVFERVKKIKGQPTPQDLFEPSYNIDMGTAYLKNLQDDYLASVKDSNARRYSVISAYNGGAGNVFRTFSADRNRALARINRLSAQEVFRQLNQNHPKLESRRYLVKVSEAQQQFWRNDGFVVK